MTTLTDRYVWAAVRTVPETHRADIEPEIREMIGGAVDARLAAGEDPAAGAVFRVDVDVEGAPVATFGA